MSANYFVVVEKIDDESSFHFYLAHTHLKDPKSNHARVGNLHRIHRDECTMRAAPIFSVLRVVLVVVGVVVVGVIILFSCASSLRFPEPPRLEYSRAAQYDHLSSSSTPPRHPNDGRIQKTEKATRKYLHATGYRHDSIPNEGRFTSRRPRI